MGSLLESLRGNSQVTPEVTRGCIVESFWGHSGLTLVPLVRHSYMNLAVLKENR